MHSRTKVLHITTSIEGGAGIAALRLNKSLNENGIDSKVLCLSSKSPLPSDVVAFKPHWVRGLVNKIQNKLFKMFGLLPRLNQIRGVSGDFEIITTTNTIYRPENSKYFKEADIIHLHWIANFINYPTFFNALKIKKVVWTLHDMNPFLGQFHYEGDLIRNEHLVSLDLEFQEIKKLAYKNLNSCTINYLNEWMKRKSQGYKLLKNFNFAIIPNCIDFKVFKPFDKEATRKEFGIPFYKTVLLFASQSLKNKRKGFDLLIKSLNGVENKSSLFILTFGHGKLEVEGIETKNMGTIKDKSLMAKIYSASDVFLMPSREDNLPNVMLESWACGTPVISFDNGGMRNHIKDFNGLLISSENTKEFSGAIDDFSKKSYNSQEIIDYCKMHFSPDIIAKQMIDVYKSLMEK